MRYPHDCRLFPIVFVEPPVSFSNLLKDMSRAGEKSKIYLRPLNMFCLFIEIYLSVAEAILKLLESVKCDFK
jgi:hypothetical protein